MDTTAVKERINHAELRAALLKYFGVSEPHTIKQFMDDKADKLADIGNPDRPAILYQLTVLCKGGMLKQGQIKGEGGYTENVYCGFHSDKLPTTQASAPAKRGRKPKFQVPEPEAVQMNEVPENVSAHIMLQVVKNTGRVRVGINGLIVEIGVSDN